MAGNHKYMNIITASSSSSPSNNNNNNDDNRYHCAEQAEDTSRATTVQLCPTGYFCPNGTHYGYEWPCPAGKFNDVQGQDEEADCQLCTPGRYCPQSASYQYLCEPGTYNVYVEWGIVRFV